MECLTSIFMELPDLKGQRNIFKALPYRLISSLTFCDCHLLAGVERLPFIHSFSLDLIKLWKL